MVILFYFELLLEFHFSMHIPLVQKTQQCTWCMYFLFLLLQAINNSSNIMKTTGTYLYLHCTANPFPVMKTGFSLCSFSHREIPVMKTGSLQWEQGSTVMKTGFPCVEKLTGKTLFSLQGMGLQWVLGIYKFVVQPTQRTKVCKYAVRIRW